MLIFSVTLTEKPLWRPPWQWPIHYVVRLLGWHQTINISIIHLINIHTLRWAYDWKKSIWKPIYHQIWQDVNSYNCLYLFRRNPIFYYTLTKVVCRYWTRNIPYIPNQGCNLSDPIWVNPVSIWSIWTDRDIFAATKQLYEWLSPSVRPSVRPSVCLSVCHTFSLCSHHRIIIKFSGVITNESSDVNAKHKVRGRGWKSQWSIYPFHIWWWNDAQSLMLLRRGALLFFKFIPQIAQSLKQLRNGALLFMQDAHQMSRSHGTNVTDFDPNWVFPDCNSSLNLPMAFKWCIKLDVL